MTQLRRWAWLLTMVGVSAAACTSGGPTDTSSTSRAPAVPIVYAAIGASETVGVGATDPLRDAWPQVLFRTALPESAVFYNFGVPGATVAGALGNQVPEAVSVQPALVTVWLNVNDLATGVSAAEYEADLDELVHTMRRGGAATVLVANTPYLDRLPLYIDCRAGTPPPGVQCPPGLSQVTPDQVNAEVAAYNAAIQRVVQREGAILVDLHAQGEVAVEHPDWVSSDGFHPSSAGYAAIAESFASALKRAGNPVA
jgi:acyl-CoA thioesterase I